MNIQEVIQICENNKLLSLTDVELRLFLKQNNEYKNFVNDLYASKFKYADQRGFKIKLDVFYKAFKYSLNTWSEVKLFVLEQLIDRENEVSPSKLNLLIKMNPIIKDTFS